MGIIHSSEVGHLLVILEDELSKLSHRLFQGRGSRRLKKDMVTLSSDTEKDRTHRAMVLSDDGDIVVLDGRMALLNKKTRKYDGMDFETFVEVLFSGEQPSTVKVEVLKTFINNVRKL